MVLTSDQFHSIDIYVEKILQKNIFDDVIDDVTASNILMRSLNGDFSTTTFNAPQGM